jgi:hypothetical protein
VLFGFPALLPIPKRKKFTTNGPQPILRNQELAPNYNRFNGGGLPSKTNIILRWEFPNPSQEDRRSCATSKNLNTKSSNNTKRNPKKRPTTSTTTAAAAEDTLQNTSLF